MSSRSTLRRRVAIGLGTVVVLVFGVVELASMAFYGDLAKLPAVPALVPPALGAALLGPLAAPPWPPLMRAAYAAALLHRGNVASAAAVVAGLPDRPNTADLRGQLAEQRGDLAAALVAYVRAGDLERAQRLIDARAADGRNDEAAHLERALADALTGSGQSAVHARAIWRLGQMTEVEATAATAGQRQALERESLALYEQALTAAPNEETYLLAAGQQALTLGDKAAATRYYTRALDAVPGSADARAGLLRSAP